MPRMRGTPGCSKAESVQVSCGSQAEAAVQTPGKIKDPNLHAPFGVWPHSVSHWRQYGKGRCHTLPDFIPTTDTLRGPVLLSGLKARPMSLETSLRVWRGYNFLSVRTGYFQQGSPPPSAFWARQYQHQKCKASVRPRLKNWNLHHPEPRRLTESPRNMGISSATAGEPDPLLCFHRIY